jgi:large subunit ribosomal protein L9
MKVILRQNVSNLGQMGDAVTVKDGYSRNYLIPRNLAYVASPGAMKALEVEKKLYYKKQEKEKVAAEALANQLAELQISIPVKVGEEGKLYGSVTNNMIADAINSRGFSIDKRNILLDDVIKSLGVFDVKIKLFNEVNANVKVWVISEEE